MVKEPRPGRVKTRLGRDIGMVEAAWWFRRNCASLLRHIEDARWDTLLAVSPSREGLSSKVWPRHVSRVPQGAGNLGDRMGRLLRSMPPGPVAIIGADIPDVDRKSVAEAFRLLGDHDAVFGPAEDGGYWLVGLKRSKAVPSSLFDGVRWSTEHALTDSAATLGNRRIAYARTLRDVDRAADLGGINPRLSAAPRR